MNAANLAPSSGFSILAATLISFKSQSSKALLILFINSSSEISPIMWDSTFSFPGKHILGVSEGRGFHRAQTRELKNLL